MRLREPATQLSGSVQKQEASARGRCLQRAHRMPWPSTALGGVSPPALGLLACHEAQGPWLVHLALHPLPSGSWKCSWHVSDSHTGQVEKTFTKKLYMALSRKKSHFVLLISWLSKQKCKLSKGPEFPSCIDPKVKIRSWHKSSVKLSRK